MKNYTVKVFEDGSKVWLLNGERHREDGPAIEFSSGTKAWYLNGEKLTKKEHMRRTSGVTMENAIAAGDAVILREQAERIKELEARVAALEQDEDGVLMERYWEAKLKEKNA